MSEYGVLEKIKDSEDSYSKAVELAKKDSENIIKAARMQAEIIMHDAVESAKSNADSIRANAIKEADIESKSIIEKYKTSIAGFSVPGKDSILAAMQQAIKEHFGV
ncbi:hypothetical protein M1373_01875 [Candidatus Marsarchaeota archaeon]|nr:hypothetical protein [Candidatus Marsarchaeota archaeon]MCL5404341.1 hypothetical protein [Candidatus Marsarchaeota archaeon]